MGKWIRWGATEYKLNRKEGYSSDAAQAWDSSAETRISAVLELNLVISVIRPDPSFCFFNMGGLGLANINI